MSRLYSHRYIPAMGHVKRDGSVVMSDAFSRFMDELVTSANTSFAQTVEKAGGLPFARYAQRPATSIIALARYDQPALDRQFASYGDAGGGSIRTASYRAGTKQIRTASYGAPMKSLRSARYG